MPKTQSTRRSGRKRKVIDYSYKDFDEQVKEVARADKRKYYSDWRKKDRAETKAINAYHQSLLANEGKALTYEEPEPETPDEPESESDDEEEEEEESRLYLWTDVYDEWEDLERDIEIVKTYSDTHRKVINDFLEQDSEFSWAFLAQYVNLCIEFKKLKK